jgi:hypothetical protein
MMALVWAFSYVKLLASPFFDTRMFSVLKFISLSLAYGEAVFASYWNWNFNEGQTKNAYITA